MQLPEKLTPAQSAAIVSCLLIFAKLGEDDDEQKENCAQAGGAERNSRNDMTTTKGDIDAPTFYHAPT